MIEDIEFSDDIVTEKEIDLSSSEEDIAPRTDLLMCDDDEIFSQENKIETDISPDEEDYDDLTFIAIKSVKETLNEEKNVEYKEMLISSFCMLKKRGFLNYDNVRKEIVSIRKNSIRIEDYVTDDTDLGMYHRIMNDIDQYRSRLSDIMSYTMADQYWIEKTYETLFNIWVGKFSSLSSDKKREGEAEMILFFLMPEKIRRKELYELAKNKFQQLNLKMETLSRKATITMVIAKSFPGNGHEYDTDSPFRASYRQVNTETHNQQGGSTTLFDGDGKGVSWDTV